MASKQPLLQNSWWPQLPLKAINTQELLSDIYDIVTNGRFDGALSGPLHGSCSDCCCLPVLTSLCMQSWTQRLRESTGHQLT